MLIKKWFDKLLGNNQVVNEKKMRFWWICVSKWNTVLVTARSLGSHRFFCGSPFFFRHLSSCRYYYYIHTFVFQKKNLRQKLLFFNYVLVFSRDLGPFYFNKNNNMYIFYINLENDILNLFFSYYVICTSRWDIFFFYSINFFSFPKIKMINAIFSCCVIYVPVDTFLTWFGTIVKSISTHVLFLVTSSSLWLLPINAYCWLYLH